MKRTGYVVLMIIVLGAAISAWASLRPETRQITLSPNLEDRLPDGSLHNPSTQSFLRGNYWLDRVGKAEFSVGSDGRGSFRFNSSEHAKYLSIQNLPLDQLVPRLHYWPASPPDAFDAFNLMLAEFSRNSLSVPIGKATDRMAHFETNLEEAVPWTLAGDYEFQPNSQVRPVRVGVVNNCLAPGLWELVASDRTGQIYHSWFEMPLDSYIDLLAKTNDIDRDFARQAVQWRTDPVPLELDRLRRTGEEVSDVACTVIGDAPVGFSSQDSRRKLHKHFVEVERDQDWGSPQTIDELTTCRSRFSDFIAPGKYSAKQRKAFDFRFLRNVQTALVRHVEPRTRYDWNRPNNDKAESARHGRYVEFVLILEDHKIVLGNLPTRLLVPQEDYVIHGFGVGVLSSSGLAERRKYLVEQGPAPSFAYLCTDQEGRLIGLNSHDYGIEQIFIRTHIDASPPWWEVTITSYERVVDIVKYRLEIPAQFQDELKTLALEYVSPLYRTYRDDNLR